jgi:hypothetical protein
LIEKSTEKKRTEMEDESACKPDSVVGGHPSRIAVADDL